MSDAEMDTVLNTLKRRRALLSDAIAHLEAFAADPPVEMVAKRGRGPVSPEERQAIGERMTASWKKRKEDQTPAGGNEEPQ